MRKGRPNVVLLAFAVLAGADPSVLFLPGEDGIDVSLCTSLHVLVFQQPGKGDKAIEPVGNAFPAFLVSADPPAVAHVRPDFIEVSGKPFRLDLQLALQPAGRLDFIGGIRGEYPGPQLVHCFIPPADQNVSL